MRGEINYHVQHKSTDWLTLPGFEALVLLARDPERNQPGLEESRLTGHLHHQTNELRGCLPFMLKSWRGLCSFLGSTWQLPGLTSRALIDPLHGLGIHPDWRRYAMSDC
jgi:hypothetical protein